MSLQVLYLGTWMSPLIIYLTMMKYKKRERERETDGMGKQKLIQPGIGAN